MFTESFEKNSDARTTGNLIAHMAAKKAPKAAFNKTLDEASHVAAGRATAAAVPKQGPISQVANQGSSAPKYRLSSEGNKRLQELRSKSADKPSSGFFSKKPKPPSKTSLPSANPQSMGDAGTQAKIDKAAKQGKIPNYSAGLKGEKSVQHPSTKATPAAAPSGQESKGWWSSLHPDTKSKIKWGAGGIAAGALAHGVMSGGGDNQQRPQLGY